MQHISNYLLKWDQVIAKRNAEQINLSRLPKCGRCGTTVREGLCSYCKTQKDYEEKEKILVKLSKQIMYDHKYEIDNDRYSKHYRNIHR